MEDNHAGKVMVANHSRGKAERGERSPAMMNPEQKLLSEQQAWRQQPKEERTQREPNTQTKYKHTYAIITHEERPPTHPCPSVRVLQSRPSVHRAPSVRQVLPSAHRAPSARQVHQSRRAGRQSLPGHQVRRSHRAVHGREARRSDRSGLAVRRSGHPVRRGNEEAADRRTGLCLNMEHARAKVARMLHNISSEKALRRSKRCNVEAVDAADKGILRDRDSKTVAVINDT